MEEEVFLLLQTSLALLLGYNTCGLLVFSTAKLLENDIPDWNSGCRQMVKEGNFLEPVPPFYQGQGFPYAPTDWPGPGETWGWKVGRRISSCGYYTDRFLIPPRSLQKPSCPRYFASRRSIELYILKEFPDADIDAFFASFIWRVPSTLWHSTKGELKVYSYMIYVFLLPNKIFLFQMWKRFHVMQWFKRKKKGAIFI